MSGKYYHIARTEKAQNLFDPNNKIIIQETVLNQSITDILSFHSMCDFQEGKGAQGLINALYHDKEMLIKKIPDWPEFMLDILIKSNRRYTELIFENIRIEKYSNLPSRLNCIFLCEKCEVKKWYPAISDNYKTTPPIYEFDINGKVHKADQRWLDQDILPHGNYIQAGQKYWAGDLFDQNNETTHEILFTGELTKTKKFENIEEFEKDN